MKRLICWVILLSCVGIRPAFAGNVYADNLVVIIDCSGSMQGQKLKEAKTALREVLNSIPRSVHIGLLAFGGSQGWQFNLGPRDDSYLNLAIDKLQADGNTPLGEYMKYGADRLLQQKETQLGYGNYRLLIITDGEASDPKAVEKYTPEIMARGISVDVIGVYMNKAHSLATKVHSYREARDAATLKKAIKEVVAEIEEQKNDTGTDTAFSDLAPLPDEMIVEIIKALTAAPLYPIGNRGQ